MDGNTEKNEQKQQEQKKKLGKSTAAAGNELWG